MFLNISIKSKEKWLIIILTTFVIIISASILLMFVNIDKIQNGEILKEEIDLSFAKYYVNYDMTVISNKNINTYNVKEWHKAGIITKLEYLDYMKNIVTITLKDNTCSITNSGNTAKFVINNMIDNNNISSLSTFAYLYNIVKECSQTTCKCEIQEHIKDEETVITISLDTDCLCKCSEFLSQIRISKLELILVDKVPKNYTVYDKNKKEYISIVYNVYEKNIEI